MENIQADRYHILSTLKILENKKLQATFSSNSILASPWFRLPGQAVSLHLRQEEGGDGGGEGGGEGRGFGARARGRGKLKLLHTYYDGAQC